MVNSNHYGAFFVFLQIDLTLYDPKGSSTSSMVTCDQDFCSATYGGELEGCRPELLCQYSVTYGDGSATNGYFVTDNLQYNQVTGNNQTRLVNASVTFGQVPNFHLFPFFSIVSRVTDERDS